MPEGVTLVDYKLTPLQAALIEWGRLNPYGRITVVFHNADLPWTCRDCIDIMLVRGFMPAGLWYQPLDWLTDRSLRNKYIKERQEMIRKKLEEIVK